MLLLVGHSTCRGIVRVVVFGCENYYRDTGYVLELPAAGISSTHTQVESFACFCFSPQTDSFSVPSTLYVSIVPYCMHHLLAFPCCFSRFEWATSLYEKAHEVSLKVSYHVIVMSASPLHNSIVISLQL